MESERKTHVVLCCLALPQKMLWTATHRRDPYLRPQDIPGVKGTDVVDHCGCRKNGVCVAAYVFRMIGSSIARPISQACQSALAYIPELPVLPGC